MKNSLHASAYVLLTAASLAAAGLLDRQRLAEAAADLGQLPRSVRAWLDSNREIAEIDREMEAFWKRHEARREVIAELTRRRLTLAEAAGRFRDLNAEAPCRRHLRANHPGRTEEESVCRHLIAWARGELSGRSPGLADEVAARLEAELERHLERDGTVYLPD